MAHRNWRRSERSLSPFSINSWFYVAVFVWDNGGDHISIVCKPRRIATHCYGLAARLIKRFRQFSVRFSRLHVKPGSPTSSSWHRLYHEELCTILDVIEALANEFVVNYATERKLPSPECRDPSTRR